MKPLRISVLTISDGVASGARSDSSGAAITAWASERGFELVEHTTVADRSERIAAELLRCADSGATDIVLTTGGTGFTEKDVTPEATRSVIERDAPGIAELLRSAGADDTPYTWLSRGVAGIRGRTLIVNLPGSESGVRSGLATLEPLLPHAVQLLRGDSTQKHELPDG